MTTHEPLDLIKARAVEPWEQLNRSLAEQKALETTRSKESGDAGLLAAEIIRLASDLDLNSPDLVRRFADWAVLSAAAAASGKRLLSSAARRTTLIAESHFEADGKGNYRFMKNNVVVVDPTAGRADFLPAAARAITFCISELRLEADWTPEILEGPPVFDPAVVLDAGPDKDRVFESIQIRFFKRDQIGELVKHEPQNWQLELKTSS